jgi:hypothetical protein
MDRITTVRTATADTILAIDLGKYKSVACVYRPADDLRFLSIPTRWDELTRLLHAIEPVSQRTGRELLPRHKADWANWA